MRSHFLSGTAIACTVTGATALLSGHCSAGPFVAADYATNATYANGWSAGQNGGYGFGAWSFDGTAGTNGPNPGVQQAISSASAIGTAWTLFNLTAPPPPIGPGMSEAGRAITANGGLQPGQTLEVVLQNPTTYHFYRGWDFLYYNGTNNEPAGVDVHAIRTLVFDYYTTDWSIVDDYGSTLTSLDAGTSGAAGLKYDFTLTTTNTYVATLTPLSNPSAAYSQSGPLVATNLPINYVNFRLWFGPSAGPNDVANNLEISSMTILGVVLNIQVAGGNAILSWTTNFPAFHLASSTNLAPSAVWTTNLPSPVVVNGQNVVTNPVVNNSRFYRLQQ